MTKGLVSVQNRTRSRVLAERAVVADNPWNLLIGLIPYRRLEVGQGMVLRRTGSIHTSFLRFDIDVMFLDRDGAILGQQQRVPPFRIAWAPRGTRTAVELPSGVLQSTGTTVGDTVSLDPCAESFPGRSEAVRPSLQPAPPGNPAILPAQAQPQPDPSSVARSDNPEG